MTYKHEIKHCPRCSKTFECKVGNIPACQCRAPKLSYEERVYIESKYTDCLCKNCLEALQFEYKLVRNHVFRF